jgi:hypothetical protein
MNIGITGGEMLHSTENSFVCSIKKTIQVQQYPKQVTNKSPDPGRSSDPPTIQGFVFARKVRGCDGGAEENGRLVHKV